MNRITTYKTIASLAVLIYLVNTPFLALAASSPHTVIYGRGCLSCFLTYANTVQTALGEIGITDVEIRYLESDPDATSELNQLYERLHVPADLRGNIVVNINDQFLFEDYVPVEAIIEFLMNHTLADGNLIVLRDELHGIYKIRTPDGALHECAIESTILACTNQPGTTPFYPLVPLIVVSGLLDGINPCAFAVLLFFIAILFVANRSAAVQQTRRVLLIHGMVYILAVFTAYLLMGLIFIQTVALTTFSHLIAKAGAILMIGLGIWDLKDTVWPNRGYRLGIPTSQWDRIRRRLRTLSVPTTFAAGVLVGVFEFPCTGGIYLGILGLLAVNTTFLEGVIYLILYNIAFVLPLVIILFMASNQTVRRFSLTRWQQKDQKTLKRFTGLVMIALGCFLLIFGLN